MLFKLHIQLHFWQQTRHVLQACVWLMFALKLVHCWFITDRISMGGNAIAFVRPFVSTLSLEPTDC